MCLFSRWTSFRDIFCKLKRGASFWDWLLLEIKLNGLLFEVLRHNYLFVYRHAVTKRTKLYSSLQWPYYETLYTYFIPFCTLNKLTFGFTMLSLITNWTITSVACSVARHRRYTFPIIQTRVRRCQAAIKSRNVSCTILSTTNLEKRWICYRPYLKNGGWFDILFCAWQLDPL